MTKDSVIEGYISDIRTAVRGTEVRSGIANGIEKCFADVDSVVLYNRVQENVTDASRSRIRSTFGLVGATLSKNSNDDYTLVIS